LTEGPEGKVYASGAFTNAGGTTDADYLARWNPASQAWEAVVPTNPPGNFAYYSIFDANGDLYVRGGFAAYGSSDGNRIVKITDLGVTPIVNGLGIVTNGTVYSMAISPAGTLYIGGSFTTAGGVAGTSKIAYWNGSVWNAVSAGLNSTVYSLAFAPNGD